MIFAIAADDAYQLLALIMASHVIVPARPFPVPGAAWSARRAGAESFEQYQKLDVRELHGRQAGGFIGDRVHGAAAGWEGFRWIQH